jgi:hypothetical protein
MATEGEGWVEGPAFPFLVKLLATGLVAAMLLWGARAFDQMRRTEWSFGPAAILVLAVAMVLWCLFWIWRSRTGVDGTQIRQSWMWPKHVRLADITQARIVGVPGLNWIIAPRLVVRARGRGIMVFHSADRRVLDAFGAICLGADPTLLRKR